ncbi:hypothetical protein SAMN06298216_1162 [Spirosomataceae bacterium TFI 002]|nr:hypothetical protein SAMN06298216_1162 [Spirosomataceae bacterium TFI 002]
MDARLATYLFGEELLYSVARPQKETVESTPVPEVKEPVVTAKQEVVIKPKEIVAEAPISTPIVKPETPAMVDKDDFVFNMNTHHLLVFSGLEPDEKDFLLKILQALGLSFTKVDLLDIQKDPLIDFKQTIHENVVRTIIFFGEESGKDFLPKLKLPTYEVKNLKNINFLYSDRLKQVAANTSNEKRQLWDSLKSIFQN